MHDWAELSLDARFVIAIVFLISGVLKINGSGGTEQLELLQVVGIYPSLPVRLASRLLPFVEILVAAWLIGKWLLVIGLVSALSLLSLLTVVIVIGLRKGYEGGCGCFGSSGGDRIGVSNVLFNVTLLATCILAAVAETKRQTAALAFGDLGISDGVMIGATFVWILGIDVMVRKVESVHRILRRLSNE